MPTADDKFPFPPAECRERGCARVQVYSHWGSNGYEVEHAGIPAFLVGPAEIANGLWPATALQRFRDAHREDDPAPAVEPVQEPAVAPRPKRRRSKKQG